LAHESDVSEKLIVKLGQLISEQNEILRMIAASLEGIESHLIKPEEKESEAGRESPLDQREVEIPF
jgi:hypothetical protein